MAAIIKYKYSFEKHLPGAFWQILDQDPEQVALSISKVHREGRQQRNSMWKGTEKPTMELPACSLVWLITGCNRRKGKR